MPAVVWGTKVKEEEGGVLAMRCPFCGELTVGDELVFSKASHVYFISGSYKEYARLARCRLCGIPTSMSDNMRAVDGTTVNQVVPDADLIERTNPDVEQQRVPEITDLPEGVGRQQWAFLVGLGQAMAEKSKNLSGWTGALGIAMSIVLLVLGISLTVKYGPTRYFENSPLLAIGGVLVPVVIALLWVWRIHRKLVDRALPQEMSEPLRRFLDYTGTTYDDLLLAAAALGRDGRKAYGHLDRARWRYGL
jgi:hypothetical protein